MRQRELEDLIGEAIAHPEQFTQHLPRARGPHDFVAQPYEPQIHWQARAVRVALEREGELVSDP